MDDRNQYEQVDLVEHDRRRFFRLAGIGVGGLALAAWALPEEVHAAAATLIYSCGSAGAPTNPLLVHNVTAYGASGNGVGNQRAAIEAAFCAAQQKGGVVFFPPGTYRIKDTLHVSHDIVIVFSAPRNLGGVGAADRCKILLAPGAVLELEGTVIAAPNQEIFDMQGGTSANAKPLGPGPWYANWWNPASNGDPQDIGARWNTMARVSK